MQVNKERRNLIIVLAVALAVISSVAWIPGIDPLFFTDYTIKKNLNKIRDGMERDDVIALMGQPDKEDVAFHLGQYEGFEREYEAAADSDAESYLYWYGRIDMVYVVGLDKEGKVTIVSRGGT